MDDDDHNHHHHYHHHHRDDNYLITVHLTPGAVRHDTLQNNVSWRVAPRRVAKATLPSATGDENTNPNTHLYRYMFVFVFLLCLGPVALCAATRCKASRVYLDLNVLST